VNLALIVVMIYFLVRCVFVYQGWQANRHSPAMVHISSVLMAIFMPYMLLEASWGFLVVAAIDSVSVSYAIKSRTPNLDLAGRKIDTLSLTVGVTTVQVALWLLVRYLSGA